MTLNFLGLHNQKDGVATKWDEEEFEEVGLGKKKELQFWTCCIWDKHADGYVGRHLDIRAEVQEIGIQHSFMHISELSKIKL